MNLIILIGFPKSGTTSLGIFFKNLGYNVIGHTTKSNRFVGMKIKENNNNNINLLDEIVDYNSNTILTQLDCCYSDTIVSWPQIELYETIYNQNINALYILNKRNPISILKSFKNQNHMDKRFFKFFINNYSKNIQFDEYIIKFIETHYNTIEKFFKDKPNFVSFFLESFDSKCFNKFICISDNLQLPISNANIALNINNAHKVLHYQINENNININKHEYERFPYYLFDINKCYNIKKYNYASRHIDFWFKNIEQFTLYCLNKNVIIYCL